MMGKNAIGRRQFLGGAAALTGGGLMACASLARADDRPLRKVTIYTTSGSQSLVFDALIKQEGFFGQMGVDATTQNVLDGGKVIAALIGGDGDMCGGAGFSSLFPAIEKGARIKILAGAGLSPLTCIYSKRSDIRTVKDLEGKTVGTGAMGALLHELVVALLLKKGVDYTKVNFVNVGSAPDIFKAVAAGTIDAGPGEIDVFDQQARYNVHALSDGLMWDELPEYTNQAMFASDQAIAAKRDTLVHALAAYAKMYRFTSSPVSRDAFFRARATGLSKNEPREAQSQWNFFQAPGRLATNLVLTPDRIRYVQELNVRLGVQKAVLPFDQVADMSLAQDALKLLA